MSKIKFNLTPQEHIKEIKECGEKFTGSQYYCLYKEDIDKLIPYIEEKDKEIERLNKKYNKALELLADYNMPCEYDEGKIPDDYCEENCSDDYKKCWDKYIELELKGDKE